MKGFLFIDHAIYIGKVGRDVYYMPTLYIHALSQALAPGRGTHTEMLQLFKAEFENTQGGPERRIEKGSDSDHQCATSTTAAFARQSLNHIGTHTPRARVAALQRGRHCTAGERQGWGGEGGCGR